MFDKIAELYVIQKEFEALCEMSMMHTSGNVSMFDKKDFVDGLSEKSKSIPIIADLGSNIKLHKLNNGYLSTVDGKATSMNVFGAFNATPEFPYEHMRQTIVDQSIDAPKGISRNVVIHVAKNSELPIASDKQQTQHGHKMWRKLVPQALDNGLHVNYWDGSKLHPTNRDNMEDHLNSYYGDSNAHINRHMIISKTKI